MSVRGPRIAAVVTAIVVAAGAAAARASADTLSLAVTGSTDQGVTVNASGGPVTAAVTLNVQYFQAGTGGCPPAPGGGTAIDPDGTPIQLGGQPFSVSSSNPVALPPGQYQICGWLTNASSSVTATASAPPLTVTAADTLALSLPSDPIEGQALTVTASGSAYDPEAAVYATYKPAGGGCAPTPAADTGTVSDSADAVTGNYSTQPVSSQQFDAGSYLICVWLVDSDDNQVLAGASTMLDVAALGPSIHLTAPTRVDPGETFPVNLTATLDAGIPVLAQADVVPERRGTTCAANPDGEPTNTLQPLTQESLTDTQLPSGAVSTTDGEAQLAAYGRYLICGWLLNGWSTAQTPPTVAGPISTTVTVLRPLIFRGTSKRDALSITVGQASRELGLINASDRLRCAKPAFLVSGQPWNGDSRVRLTPQEFGTVHLGSGSFHLRANPKPNVTFNLTGRLSRGVIKVSFTEVGTPAGLVGNRSERFECTSGTVRFTLRS